MAEGFARCYGSDVMDVQSAGLAPAVLLSPETRKCTLGDCADGGSTSDINLAGFCVRHHHLKHAGGGWQVRALPDGGLEWTTPTGHTRVTRPYDYRGVPDPP